MTNATPEIKDFLNNVFKNEESSRDINKEIGELFKDSFSKKLLDLTIK